MYAQQTWADFSRVCKLNLVADPSTYQGQDTVVGLLYSWEINRGACGMIQVIRPGKQVMPDEFEMPGSLWARCKEGKAERVKALREMHAMSAMCKRATGRSFDEIDLPADVDIETLGPDDIREVDGATNPAENKVVIRNQRTGETRCTLPDGVDPGKFNQLTIAIDSGATVRAGASFIKNQLRSNIFVHYDKIHRIIRDIKLASEHSKGGEVYRAVLQMSFVWSLNQKPFGSGVFYEKKGTMLEQFLSTESCESALFRHYAPLIARDCGISFGGEEEDYVAVWDEIASCRAMPSFQRKGATPKMMRRVRRVL